MSLKNPVTPPAIDPGTFRLVAQRLNHYATPGPIRVKGTDSKLQDQCCRIHNNKFIILSQNSILLLLSSSFAIQSISKQKQQIYGEAAEEKGLSP